MYTEKCTNYKCVYQWIFTSHHTHNSSKIRALLRAFLVTSSFPLCPVLTQQRVVPPLYLTRIIQDVLVGTYIFKWDRTSSFSPQVIYFFLPSLSVLCKTLGSKVFCVWCSLLGNYTCVFECPRGSSHAAEIGVPWQCAAWVCVRFPCTSPCQTALP